MYERVTTAHIRAVRARYSVSGDWGLSPLCGRYPLPIPNNESCFINACNKRETTQQTPSDRQGYAEGVLWVVRIRSLLMRCCCAALSC